MRTCHELRSLVRGELSLESPARWCRRMPLSGLSAVTLLAWGMGSGSLVGQAPYQQEHLPGFSTLLVGQNSLPSVGDLDGDGDFDIVVGERYGGLSLFENTGSSRAPAFVVPISTSRPFHGIDVGYESAPALVDLDADGDLDAVVGADYGNLRTFENTGTSNAPAFVARTGSANPFDMGGINTGRYSSPAFGDLDGDGDLDAVVGEDYGTVLTFENTGSARTPAFEERIGAANPFDGFDFGSASHPDLVDLDGDGDLDAVIGGSTGRLRSFENTGSSSSPAFEEQTGAANLFDPLGIQAAKRADFADLDGDGDLDAVVGGSFGSLSLLESTGTSSEPALMERVGTRSPFGGTRVGSDRHPDLVDLDGDGDLDVVSGDYSGRLGVFENTGTPREPALVGRARTLGPLEGFDVGIFSTPTLADLDGDGDSDAVVGEGFGGLQTFENTGSSSALAFTEQLGSENPFDGIVISYLSIPSLADVDGDGDFDVVVGEGYGRVVFLRSSNRIFGDGFEAGDASAWSKTLP